MELIPREYINHLLPGILDRQYTKINVVTDTTIPQIEISAIFCLAVNIAKNGAHNIVMYAVAKEIRKTHREVNKRPSGMERKYRTTYSPTINPITSNIEGRTNEI